MASEFTLGLVDKRGQLSAFAAEKEGSWSGPVPVGAAGLADPGAPVAASQRSGPDRTDVFVIDKKGTLTVFSADGEGHWSPPELVEQAGALPGGAYVAASPQFGVKNRTDIFFINQIDANATGWPEVTWAEEKGVWKGPKKLSTEV
jgi:hypothetical protein